MKPTRSKSRGCWGTARTPSAGPRGAGCLRGAAGAPPRAAPQGTGAAGTARGEVWHEIWAFPGIFQRMAWLWLGGSLAPQSRCTVHQPRPVTPTHLGAVVGATTPCNIRERPQRLRALKKGRKGWVWAELAGGGEASSSAGAPRGSCPGRAGFPGRGELSALPWPRGAVGALSHPTAPRSCPGLCRGARIRRAHIWGSEWGRRSRLGGTRRGKGDVCLPRGGGGLCL